MIRHTAGWAIGSAALFLLLVAILIGSGALFYMSTAMIATIGASRFQAWLSVRGLRFDRIAPESVTAGDLVTVEIVVWSEKRIRRPLVTVIDNLPSNLHPRDYSPSLPIAPAFDQPIRTQYRFRPMRRGKYSWTGLTAYGTDALGLVTASKVYDTSKAEITVLPVPIPVSIELPRASSWGINEVESGRSRGAGIEPRGVREYAAGDPLRHIHWRSTAKRGSLLVKEFEAGSHAPAAFIIQRTVGTDVGVGHMTSFEAMCGHVAYLSDRFLRQGVLVEFPTTEERVQGISHKERQTEILDLLASLTPDLPQTVGEELLGCLQSMESGAIVYVLAAVADQDLAAAAAQARQIGVSIIVLAYDAETFVPAAKRENRARKLKEPRPSNLSDTSGEWSAASSAYRAELRDAGALVIEMPLEGLHLE